ncbi:MAG TPA: hypothetical protein VM889_03115 [Candidatus Thermoplasmatota archaeon]|nr:hypothetical protein [Candidatus Thermoplasmatota archaeon]
MVRKTAKRGVRKTRANVSRKKSTMTKTNVRRGATRGRAATRAPRATRGTRTPGRPTRRLASARRSRR